MDRGVKIMKEKETVQLKGRLKVYMQWPIVIAALLAALNIWIFVIDKKAGVIMLVFVVLYVVMTGALYVYCKASLMRELVAFAAQYGIVQNTLLKELEVPYAVLLDDGKVVWMNDQFEQILDEEDFEDLYISHHMPELNVNIFPKDEEEPTVMEVYYKDREYRAILTRLSVEGFKRYWGSDTDSGGKGVLHCSISSGCNRA